MYERLTQRTKNGGVKFSNGEYWNTVYPQNENCLTDIHRMAIRLCEIEDKIEQGKILELPCKVGDMLWKIEDVWHLDDRATWKYHYEKEIVEFMVRSISISCNSKGIWTKKFRICEVDNGKTIDKQRNIEFADYGKTVFLDRASAEAKLREMEGDNNEQIC
jgi:hypothetical protein